MHTINSINCVFIKKTFLYQFSAAAFIFFCRLKDKIYVTVKVTMLRQILYGCQQHGSRPSCPQACIIP